MKYWKKGFYDEPVEGSVEIEDYFYHELLEGQSLGKEIYEGKNGYPILVEHRYNTSEIREMKVSEISAYDKSDSVNSFILGGRQIWLDKDTRVGLMNSISIEQGIGKIDTTLWFDGVKYIIPIDNAIQMLNSLELYALSCYNVTQLHIAEVMKFELKEQIAEYDYKIGYPDKIVFNL